MRVSFLEADQVLKEGFPAVHYTILVCFIPSPPAEQGISLQPRAGPADDYRERRARGRGAFHNTPVALFSLSRHCVLRPKPKSE